MDSNAVVLTNKSTLLSSLHSFITWLESLTPISQIIILGAVTIALFFLGGNLTAFFKLNILPYLKRIRKIGPVEISEQQLTKRIKANFEEEFKIKMRNVLEAFETREDCTRELTLLPFKKTEMNMRFYEQIEETVKDRLYAEGLMFLQNSFTKKAESNNPSYCATLDDVMETEEYYVYRGFIQSFLVLFKHEMKESFRKNGFNKEEIKSYSRTKAVYIKKLGQDYIHPNYKNSGFPKNEVYIIFNNLEKFFEENIILMIENALYVEQHIKNQENRLIGLKDDAKKRAIGA